LPESSSELKSEENKMRERYSIRKQKSTTPKITPHCSTHLAKKKKKNAFAHSAFSTIHSDSKELYSFSFKQCIH